MYLRAALRETEKVSVLTFAVSANENDKLTFWLDETSGGVTQKLKGLQIMSTLNEEHQDFGFVFLFFLWRSLRSSDLPLVPEKWVRLFIFRETQRTTFQWQFWCAAMPLERLTQWRLAVSSDSDKMIMLLSFGFGFQITESPSLKLYGGGQKTPHYKDCVCNTLII